MVLEKRAPDETPAQGKRSIMRNRPVRCGRRLQRSKSYGGLIMLSLIDKFRLRGKLNSPNIGTRSKAVDFLAKNTSDPSAVKLLLMVRKKEGGNGVGYTALKAIESVKCAGAVDALLAALRDGDDGLRCGAAKALGNIRDPRSVEGLCAALKDDDGQIRWAASVALGNIGDPRAASALIEVLST